jgi:hypothetical protein
MNILINCSNIKVGGGIQVSLSFLNELSKVDDSNFVIVVSTILKNYLDISGYRSSHIIYSYDIVASPLNIMRASNSFLDSLVKIHAINNVFTVFGPSYWRPKVRHVCGFAKAQYIYKDSPFYRIITWKERLKLGVKEFLHLLDFKKNADIVVTENPDVTKKIGKILRKKSLTVTNTYHQVFDRRDEWKSVVLPPFKGKNLLTISANYPHKNLSIIPEVVQELIRRKIDRFRFVLTMKKGDLTTTDEIDKYIVYLGKVDINECPSLYVQSHYMFLPTLLECFSASYAEAMRMETICNDAAVYFDPLDPIDIVNNLLGIDEDDVGQKLLKHNGVNRLKDFDTAAERAAKYLEIIKNS